jgi:hypothetical protein
VYTKVWVRRRDDKVPKVAFYTNFRMVKSIRVHHRYILRQIEVVRKNILTQKISTVSRPAESYYMRRFTFVLHFFSICLSLWPVMIQLYYWNHEYFVFLSPLIFAQLSPCRTANNGRSSRKVASLSTSCLVIGLDTFRSQGRLLLCTWLQHVDFNFLKPWEITVHNEPRKPFKEATYNRDRDGLICAQTFGLLDSDKCQVLNRHLQ